MRDTEADGSEREIVTAESGTVALLNRAEIDVQIATAKKYPRSIKRFVDEASAMVTLNESIAQQCVYALLRWDSKKGENTTIAGPSARFGEIVASAWGNCRAGARVVSDHGEFVTAQGVFHDLERNVAITYEVQRRITTSKGARFNADMIGVTANAACSIALRNAILKGVPKAFWEPMYTKARQVIAGDVKTLGAKRKEAIQQFAHFGVSEAQILAKLGRPGLQDVGVDDLVTLFGLLTAIKDGDTTPEQAFATDPGQPASSGNGGGAPGLPAWDAERFAAELLRWAQAVGKGAKTVDEILALARSKGSLSEAQEAQIRALAKADATQGAEVAA